MFKIDWPCAIGGAVVGYYTKGKVESAKTNFKRIYTGAVASLKDSFSDYEPFQFQNTQSQGNGKPNGNGGTV